MASQNDQKPRRPMQPTKGAWTAAVIQNIETAWIAQGNFYGSIVGEQVSDFGSQRGYGQAVEDLFEVVGEDFWQASPDEPIGRLLTEATREAAADKRAYDICAAIVKGHQLAFEQFGIDAATKGTRFLDEIETIIWQEDPRARALDERSQQIDLVVKLVEDWTVTKIEGTPTPGDILQSRLHSDADYWREHAHQDDVNPLVVKDHEPTIEDLISEAYKQGRIDENEQLAYKRSLDIEDSAAVNDVLHGINFTRWNIRQGINDNARILTMFPFAINTVFPPKPLEDEPVWVQKVFAAHQEIQGKPYTYNWANTRYEFEVWRNSKGLVDSDLDPLGSLPPADFEPVVPDNVVLPSDRALATSVGQERYDALFERLLKYGRPAAELVDYQPTIIPTIEQADGFSPAQ